MVQNTREATRSSAIRPVKVPKEVKVITGEDSIPSTVAVHGDSLQVVSVQDMWSIEDEWWRFSPISRDYYQLIMKNGLLVTVFKDRVSSKWFQQSYVYLRRATLSL